MTKQRDIIDIVAAECFKVDEAIKAIADEIALIQAFRNRLIADVVTGKLDIRAAAANLPEITGFEPIDEPTEGEDLNEIMGVTESEEVAA